MQEIYCDGSGTSHGVSCHCIAFEKKEHLKVLNEAHEADEIEYLGVIQGLDFVIESKDINKEDKEIIIYSDCVRMVDELNNLAMPRKRIASLHQTAKEKIAIINEAGKEVRFIWIPREKNIAGHYLDKRINKVRRQSRKNSPSGQKKAQKMMIDSFFRKHKKIVPTRKSRRLSRGKGWKRRQL